MRITSTKFKFFFGLAAAYALLLFNAGSASAQVNPSYQINWAIASGCMTAGYVYVPQSNTCISPGSGGLPSGTGIVKVTSGTGSTLPLVGVGTGGVPTVPATAIASGHVVVSDSAGGMADSGSPLVALGTSGQIPVMNSGGTTYAPVTVSGDSTMTFGGVMTNKGMNGVVFSGLASGLYRNTTTTGVPSIETAAQLATDVQTAAQTLTGCTTAGYVYSPQSNTCVAVGGGGFTIPSGVTSLWFYQAGSGTTVADVVGSNNCTLNTASGWTTLGYQFGGTNFTGAGTVETCPAAAFALNGALQMWYKPNPVTNNNSSGQVNSIFSADTPQFIFGMYPSQGGAVFAQTATSNRSGNSTLQTADHIYGNQSLLLNFISSGPTVTFNGEPPSGYLATQGNLPASICTTSCYFGATTGAATQGQAMQMYAKATWATAPTQAQAAQLDSYVRQQLNTYGIRFGGDGDDHSKSVFINTGDSISIAYQDSFYPRSTYAYVAAPAGYEVYNLGVGGTQSTQLAVLEPLMAKILASHAGQQNVVDTDFVTNDIAAGTSAATIYSNLQNFCSWVHTNFAPSKCLVQTMLSRCTVNTNPSQTTQYNLFNSTVLSAWAAGTINADFVVDAGDGTMAQAQNTTTSYPTCTSGGLWYVDGLHPTQLGYTLTTQKHKAAVAEVLSGREVWVPLDIIPYTDFSQTSGTTGTLSIKQLGPNEKVCGVTQNVTTAFTAPSITSLTSSVGNSNGNATTYQGALSLLATGSQDSFASGGATISPSGVLNVTFTSNVALNTLTAGSMNLNVCLYNQQ